MFNCLLASSIAVGGISVPESGPSMVAVILLLPQSPIQDPHLSPFSNGSFISSTDFTLKKKRYCQHLNLWWFLLQFSLLLLVYTS